ncbi:hemerythrin-like metal-binding domain-containing protein [Helicobacter aurati]|uniref:Hemerythrin-like metal-binding domain-containing protein n=1 Tax=Helicobacter aurati TaxID=137778 RepID=A0A3D8J0J5_9HELI|nr:hemerythrin-like metal-binding domain-containing protein [Helicobacter aurati]
MGKQTDPAEIKKMLAALFEYMKTHFRDEETYMENMQYPYLDSHREHHRNIILDMTHLIKNMKYDFKQQLVIIMEQWLLKHILQEDMQIGEYQQEILQAQQMQKEHLEQNTVPKDSPINYIEHNEHEPKNDLHVDTNKKIKKQSVLHIYSCMCGRIYNIAPNIHANLQNGHTLRCKHCHTNISFISDMKI